MLSSKISTDDSSMHSNMYQVVYVEKTSTYFGVFKKMESV